LAIVDPQSNERWFVECTPDFPAQLEALDRQFPVEQKPGINGILLTHAHVGHYAGLMHLGREVLGARNVKVFAMPKMRTFLTDNGPWSQLVALSNIRLASLTANEPTQLNARLRVTPLLVPHRDEFSETVGFLISGHPFIAESIERFATLPATERAKVQFIHLNHTNPALQADSAARREIIAAGHDIVEQGEKFSL
jgi:pyrroloquinoline quinone biosynthesis protein B